MKIVEFATLVAKSEGKKKQISVAQVSEVLRIVNELTWGGLYLFIRLQKAPTKG